MIVASDSVGTRPRWLVSNGPVQDCEISVLASMWALSGRDAVELTVGLFTVALRRW